jgi:hypothetical protein
VLTASTGIAPAAGALGQAQDRCASCGLWPILSAIARVPMDGYLPCRRQMTDARLTPSLSRLHRDNLYLRGPKPSTSTMFSCRPDRSAVCRSRPEYFGAVRE